MGNNSVIDKRKSWVLLIIISDKRFFERNPPEDIVVKARLSESSNLMFTKLYKKMTKIDVAKILVNKIIDNFLKL